MTDNDSTNAAAVEHGDVGVHIVPLPILVSVWAGLLVLTGVTVAVTYVDLGGLNLWIAMIIATIKATFVALYFMHLRYDHPFHAFILFVALLFIALFIGLVLIDSSAQQYQITEFNGV